MTNAFPTVAMEKCGCGTRDWAATDIKTPTTPNGLQEIAENPQELLSCQAGFIRGYANKSSCAE